MIVLGVTGNLASGKSEAARVFKKHGALVFDADRAARRAVRKGTPAYKAVVKLFGREYLRKNGEIDRKKLAERVFSRPEDLKKLNIVIHPGVIIESMRTIERARRKKGILVMDVPLLFESKMEDLADRVLVVSSKKEKMVARAVKNGMPAGLARKILSSQWPIGRKEKLADYVIHNNGTLRDLEKAVLRLVREIREKI
jgi:dephospho-CoA kinase